MEYNVFIVDGCEYWFKKGTNLYHREDGPAVIYSDGRKFYYIEGEIHREDGPAIIDSEGKEFYFLNDVNYKKSDWEEKLKKKKREKENSYNFLLNLNYLDDCLFALATEHSSSCFSKNYNKIKSKSVLVQNLKKCISNTKIFVKIYINFMKEVETLLEILANPSVKVSVQDRCSDKLLISMPLKMSGEISKFVYLKEYINEQKI